MARDSFVFYRSFKESIRKMTPEQRLACLDAIIDYALDDEETDDGVAFAILEMAKPIIDKNNKRYENGKSGGRKPKQNQTETKPEPNQNQTVTNPEPYVDVDVDVSVDADVDVSVSEEVDGDIKNICSEQAAEQTVVPDCEALILNDGSDWWPTVEKYSELQRLYPNADVQKEFAKMRAWCIGNPNKRKTKAGAMRFVTNWLNKAQDGSRASPHQSIFDKMDSYVRRPL